ncbi:MAG: PAS domain-containing protein [Leucobacter sp.]
MAEGSASSADSLPDIGAEPEGALRYPRTADGERLLAAFSQVVEPIGRALPANVEVVLHDLSKLPNSIVAMHGSVTGRRIGDPATDLLLKRAASGTLETSVGYETRLPDGRRLSSSTTIIRDVMGNPVLAFCVNSDLSAWQEIGRIVSSMIGEERLSSVLSESEEAATEVTQERFVRDVDELAEILLRDAIEEAGVPVELMQKRHKLEIVRALKTRGMFLLRDAVETVADALRVTRFTIYNYLNEIGGDEKADKSIAAEEPT